jgi:hypothetical protein
MLLGKAHPTSVAAASDWLRFAVSVFQFLAPLWPVSSRQLNCATNDANNRRDGSSNAGAPILAVIIGIARIVGVVSQQG